MVFYADLHVHSKYSRATSRNCDLEHLAWWARRKGIAVVGTGDFTHPAWFGEIREKLVPAEPGLFRLRADLEKDIDRRLPATCQGSVRFMLEVEISTIYKKGDKTRKVHHLIYAPDLDTAGRFRDRLGQIGNIASDGRPILGLDSRDLLEITLESGPGAYLVPAHIWTPWFAALGSKSGFDTIEACYGDLAEHIFAVETGLSSDPPMNWRVSHLDRFTLVSNSDAHSPPMLGREACVFDVEVDYFAIRRALETGEGYGGTVEFFPEEGKYHLDGHRACGVRLEPEETRLQEGRCPACGKPLTVGVMHRVLELADRPAGARAPEVSPFRSLVPLPEIVSELEGVGAKSKRVERAVSSLVSRLGPELDILERLPIEDVEREADSLLAEAITRLRAGQVWRESGYDGEYGVIRMFEPGEIARWGHAVLFPETFAVSPPAASQPSAPPVRAAPAVPEETAPEKTAPEKTEPEKTEPEKTEPEKTEPELAIDGPSTSRDPQNDVGEPFLSGLDLDQRAAARVTSGPLLIVAGPGTGKTRTLTHRLAHLIASGGARPQECLAITFTRRAAREMRERLQVLLPVAAAVDVATFHSLGAQILREQRSQLGLERGFRVADPGECREITGEIFELSATKAASFHEHLTRGRRWQAEASFAAQGELFDEALLIAAAAYEEALRQRNLVDFDDLLILPVRLFSQQPDLVSAYRQRWRHVSIDEYQDIDALQYRLIQLLVAADGNVCAIGDPDQSIYRFRGADVGFFLRFREDYLGARVVELRRNYRSNSTIVAAALAAIAPASLVADRQLQAMLDEAPERIVIHEAASERGEAEWVVHTLERLLGGTSYFSVDSGRVDHDDGLAALSFNDIAILYRTAAQSDALVEALDRSGIPYQRRSHQRLTELPGIEDLMQVLREASPATGARAALAAASRGFVEAEKIAPATVDLLVTIAERCKDDLERFLAEIVLGAEVDTLDPRAECVSLLTLHAAKGLEFPVVFLVGCVDGLLPLRWGQDSTPEDEAEERRLFFVGMTRARSRLFLSSFKKRRFRGKVVEVSVSPFLEVIDEALFERQREVGQRAAKVGRQLSLL